MRNKIDHKEVRLHCQDRRTPFLTCSCAGRTSGCKVSSQQGFLPGALSGYGYFSYHTAPSSGLGSNLNTELSCSQEPCTHTLANFLAYFMQASPRRSGVQLTACRVMPIKNYCIVELKKTHLGFLAKKYVACIIEQNEVPALLSTQQSQDQPWNRAGRGIQTNSESCSGGQTMQLQILTCVSQMCRLKPLP